MKNEAIAFPAVANKMVIWESLGTHVRHGLSSRCSKTRREKVKATRVHAYYPPGYGLHLFGAVIPFPPAPVLWALALLDIAATVWAWRRPTMWPVLVAGLAVSAYLTLVGIFSIGPIYLALFMVQLGRLAFTFVRIHRAGR